MTKTGARGKIINLIQMNTCVGQTAVRGSRINRGYRTKALPYFKEGDISAKARGFIKSSFIEGLTPSEFFFHAMSGRDTLIDKGINTSKSGYMQRRVMNALLDISMKEDNTVRDASGNIIQFRYGEDGANPTAGKINVDKIIEKNTHKE
jgi:DNA-directed RNA polymerase subunit A'